MMRSLLLLTMLLVLIPLPNLADEGLPERAGRVLEDPELDPDIREERLVGLADSLRTVDVPLAARCLERSGIAAFRAGRLDSALARWQRGVAWAAGANEKQSESSLLNALAIGHTARGDVEAALPVYDRALELREALADTAGLARTWGNLAQAYSNLGRLAEAMAATNEAERWLAHADNPRGRLANGLRRGKMLTTMGRLDEALWQNQEIRKLADAEGGAEARGLACLQLGESLMDLGRPAEALPILTESLTLLLASGNTFQALFAEQSHIACLILLDRPDEALTELDRVIPLVIEANQKPLLTIMHLMEGHALLALDRTDDAESVLLAARDMVEARLEAQQDERSLAGIFTSSGDVYAALAHVYLVGGRVEDAFSTVERGRAPGFRRAIGGEVASVEELQSTLARTSSALVLFNDPLHDPLVAFVLGPESLEAVVLGDAAPLAADARTALKLLAAGENLKTCRPALARLEAALLAPLAEALPPEATRLALVPPSFLAGFPLGMLQDESGQPWGDATPISFLPSATALVRLGQRDAPTQGILALADPTTDHDGTGRLPLSPVRSRVGVSLPEARREIEAVTTDTHNMLVGPAATGDELRQALAAPLGVLHLATHAVVDPIDGGRSALVLAGPGGLDAVTAREIAATRFIGDLVVLSGCSTFGEHRVLGEGWFGLPRSFLTAGARSVVSTLWDVDDLGARIFITAFYEALKDGYDRDEALRRAREVCREEGLPPRDWAAFVLSGVGAESVPMIAMGSGRLPPIAWWGMGLGLIGLVVLIRR